MYEQSDYKRSPIITAMAMHFLTYTETSSSDYSSISYSTVIQTHKGAWVPFSGYDDPI